LNNAVALKLFQRIDNFGNRIIPHRTVKHADIRFINRIQFHNVIVDLLQCFEYIGAFNKSRITQYANLGIGKITITKKQCIMNNPGKIRMTSRLTVTGKSKHIGLWPVGFHINQFILKSFDYLFISRHRGFGSIIGIQSAFTINTIKRTNFSVGRQKVNTQRDSQSARMNRTKYR